MTALMPTTVRSFAKINIGLQIGRLRADGFHELRTLYQTVALHDSVRVDLAKGTGIEVRCRDPRVPSDESNVCYRIAERVLRAFKRRARVVITIDKQLPVQGGLGGASSNAVATMLALERAAKEQLPAEDRLRIAAEVGSDLPLFLIGGTVLGVGRGEEVYPASDLPEVACVIATPDIGVSTPQAFADWDAQFAAPHAGSELTPKCSSDTINGFSRSVYAWLGGSSSGVPALSGRDRAEALLLDLVRAGIENDFERVVFPQHPELRQVKRVLQREGAGYASLSGSGSAVYGLFASAEAAKKAVRALEATRTRAVATKTLSRREYWKRVTGS
jgi:4-diphosphocytidyl-2-C-methyl-D-erythritol kinase